MKKYNRTHLGEAGISLVELMVVVAIIAVMAFFAGPEMMNIGPKAKMKAAARDLKSNLDLARMEAVKRNCPVEVSFTPSTTIGGSSYSIWIDTDGDGNPDSGEEALSLVGENASGGTYTFPDTVLLTAVNGATDTKFVFTSRGFWFEGSDDTRTPASDTTLPITTKDGAKGTYTVSVNPGGNARVTYSN